MLQMAKPRPTACGPQHALQVFVASGLPGGPLRGPGLGAIDLAWVIVHRGMQMRRGQGQGGRGREGTQEGELGRALLGSPPWPTLGCFPVFSAPIETGPNLYPPASLLGPPVWPFCSHHLFCLNAPFQPICQGSLLPQHRARVLAQWSWPPSLVFHFSPHSASLLSLLRSE